MPERLAAPTFAVGRNEQQRLLRGARGLSLKPKMAIQCAVSGLSRAASAWVLVVLVSSASLVRVPAADTRPGANARLVEATEVARDEAERAAGEDSRRRGHELTTRQKRIFVLGLAAQEKK